MSFYWHPIPPNCYSKLHLNIVLLCTGILLLFFIKINRLGWECGEDERREKTLLLTKQRPKEQTKGHIQDERIVLNSSILSKTN